MTLCGNFFLRYKNFATRRAMLTLGLTCSRASCFNSLVNNLGMTLCGNNFLFYKYLITYSTMLTFCLTRCSTSSLDCRVDDFYMGKSCFRSNRIGITTNGTGISFCACLIARRCSYNGSTVIMNRNGSRIGGIDGKRSTIIFIHNGTHTKSKIVACANTVKTGLNAECKCN